MSCGNRPTNIDGSRPQWHKDAYPWMEDEAYNRPVHPDEYVAKMEAYRQARAKKAARGIWWIVACIVLFSVNWRTLIKYPTPSAYYQAQQHQQHPYQHGFRP